MPAPYDHILVTGGAGFVGSTLALSLRELYPASRVTAFDNLRRRGSETNLSRLHAGGVTFVHGDVRAPEDLSVGGPDIDLIVECSAEPSVLAGFGDEPSYVVDTNLGGRFIVLTWPGAPPRTWSSSPPAGCTPRMP